MTKAARTSEVLITVMTYPHPSRGYVELVCTAGVTAGGEWVRLYPIDYRYRPQHQRFHKYQWVSVDLLPVGQGNDHRKESRKPVLETLQVSGRQLPAGGSWPERRAVIDPLPVHTVNQLKKLHSCDRTSLGIVRPHSVLDVKVEPVDGQWKPRWQQLANQLQLFGPPPKPLRKIPYKFSYVFTCEDSSTSHTAMIEDWELGVLWLKEADRLQNEKLAAESVRQKYLSQMCSVKRDTRFFMGTVFPYNTWVVLGVFWPERLKDEAGTVVQGRLL